MKKITLVTMLISVFILLSMMFMLASCDETVPPSTDSNKETTSHETTQCQHNYTSNVTAEATCTKDGVKTFTCSSCKDSYTESISAGHKWNDATCTTPKTCSVCKTTQGEAIGHTTENGICSRCNILIFKPLVYSGNGDKIITNINLNKGLYKVSLTHVGKSNFIVVSYDGDGTRKSSLSNEIGTYSGSVIIDYALSGGYLEIKADGNWTITIETIQSIGTSNIKGHGDCVSHFFELPKGAQVVSLSYSGKSNFVVVVYDNTGRRYSSLANETGNYSGEVIFNGGDPNKKYCIEVTASGEWTVNFGLTDETTMCSPSGKF